MTTLAEIRAALGRSHPEDEGKECGACEVYNSLPADGVIVTPDSLAAALRTMRSYVGWAVWPADRQADAILVSLAFLSSLTAEGGQA